jgi:hypothetical protein
VEHGDWDNPYGGDLLCLYTDKEEQKETHSEMRLAFVFLIPAAALFTAAQYFQIEGLVWAAVGFFVIGGAIFAFDQMDSG